MWFPGREINSFVEPVSPDRLKVGSVYFSLNFVDERQLIPVLEPLVFIGRNLNENDAGRTYFQDVDSYREGVRRSTATNDDAATFYEGPEAEMKHIFEFEQALDQLLSCFLRRQAVSFEEEPPSRK